MAPLEAYRRLKTVIQKTPAALLLLIGIALEVHGGVSYENFAGMGALG